jgi:hypothetical protein
MGPHLTSLSNCKYHETARQKLAAPFLFALPAARFAVRPGVRCMFCKRINTHQKCKKRLSRTFCAQLKKTISWRVMHLRNTPVHSFAKPQRNKQLSRVGYIACSTGESPACHRHAQKSKCLTAFQRF